MIRHRGHTLPELLVTSTVVLLLFGLIAIVLTIAARSQSRLDHRVDLQLEAQEWLSRLGDDLGGSARRRLFPGRCEMDSYARSELFRFDPASPDVQYDAAQKQAVFTLAHPVGEPEPGWEIPISAFNFDRGEVLTATRVDATHVRVTFPTAPQTGDRVLLEYPVNHLLVYWLDPATGVLRRELRDSSGSTAVELLNPPDRNPRVYCDGLELSEPQPEVVRIQVKARDDSGQAWTDKLDVSVSE